MISDGKNREANTELDTFTFKAKENGITLITIQGEFYDQAETKLEPSLEPDRKSTRLNSSHWW